MLLNGSFCESTQNLLIFLSVSCHNDDRMQRSFVLYGVTHAAFRPSFSLFLLFSPFLLLSYFLFSCSVLQYYIYIYCSTVLYRLLYNTVKYGAVQFCVFFSLTELLESVPLLSLAVFSSGYVIVCTSVQSHMCVLYFITLTLINIINDFAHICTLSMPLYIWSSVAAKTWCSTAGFPAPHPFLPFFPAYCPSPSPPPPQHQTPQHAQRSFPRRFRTRAPQGNLLCLTEPWLCLWRRSPHFDGKTLNLRVAFTSRWM